MSSDLIILTKKDDLTWEECKTTELSLEGLPTLLSKKDYFVCESKHKDNLLAQLNGEADKVIVTFKSETYTFEHKPVRFHKSAWYMREDYESKAVLKPRTYWVVAERDGSKQEIFTSKAKATLTKIARYRTDAFLKEITISF